MSRTYFRPALVPVLALAAACGGAGDDVARQTTADTTHSPYGATTAENIRVVPVEIEVPDLPPGWEGMRLAAISDFQLGLWPDNAEVARAAVQRAMAEKPDAYVLLGDYVARGRDYAALERVLAPLRGQRVFAVLGDEDMEDDPEGPDSTRILVTQALQRSGVTVLVDARAPLNRRGDTAYIAGVQPYVARRPDWRRAEIWGGIPGEGTTPVVLAHMPVTAATLPTDKYGSMISGHTFCGQVEVPGTPRLTWLNTEVFPQEQNAATNRIYRIRGTTLFVTCGTGYGFVPIRFGAPPEVAMITLRGVGMATPDSAATAPGGVNVDSLIQQFTPDSVSRDTTAG